MCDPFFLFPYYTVYPCVLATSIVSSHVALSPLHMGTQSDNETLIAIHRYVGTLGTGVGSRKGVNGTNESYLGHSRAIYTRRVEIYFLYGKRR